MSAKAEAWIGSAGEAPQMAIMSHDFGKTVP
jgi:hypothetical protein